MGQHHPKPASQRQLKVGEAIRHALAEIFQQDKLYHSSLSGIAITVSEVKVSPDLRNATVYVTPMGANASEDFIEALNSYSSYLRQGVNQRVNLRFSPKLFFKIDDSFEHATRIYALLSNIGEEEDDHDHEHCGHGCGHYHR